MEKFSLLNSQFIILFVKVTEEIKSKHLKSFISSQLQLKNIAYKNKKVYFSFIKQLSAYQIIVFENSKFDFLFFDNLKTNIKYIVLVIEFYILVLKNKQLYYLLPINYSLDKNQITQLIINKLQLKSFEIMLLSKEEIKIAIKNTKKNSSNLIHYSSFLTLDIFLFICFFCIASFFIYINKSDKNQNNIKYKKAPILNKKTVLSKKLLNIYKELDLNKIHLKQGDFSTNKYSLIVLSNSLLKVESFSKQLAFEIEYIKFDQKEDKYEVSLFKTTTK